MKSFFNTAVLNSTTLAVTTFTGLGLTALAVEQRNPTVALAAAAVAWGASKIHNGMHNAQPLF